MQIVPSTHPSFCSAAQNTIRVVNAAYDFGFRFNEDYNGTNAMIFKKDDQIVHYHECVKELYKQDKDLAKWFLDNFVNEKDMFLTYFKRKTETPELF